MQDGHNHAEYHNIERLLALCVASAVNRCRALTKSSGKNFQNNEQVIFSSFTNKCYVKLRHLMQQSENLKCTKSLSFCISDHCCNVQSLRTKLASAPLSLTLTY